MLHSVFSRAAGCVAALVLIVSSPVHAADAGRVELAGHVLSGLETTPSKSAASESTPLTLTVVLQRTDEAGFELYSPTSTLRHRRNSGVFSSRRSKCPIASDRASPTTRT